MCVSRWWMENSGVRVTQMLEKFALAWQVSSCQPFFPDVNVVDLLEKPFLTPCSTRIIAVWCFKIEVTSPCAHKTAFPPSGSKLLPVLLFSLSFVFSFVWFFVFLGQLSDISWGRGTYISIVITSNLWRSICLTIKHRERAERILLLIRCFNEPGN